MELKKHKDGYYLCGECGGDSFFVKDGVDARTCPCKVVECQGCGAVAII